MYVKWRFPNFLSQRVNHGFDPIIYRDEFHGFSIKKTIQLLGYSHLWKPPNSLFLPYNYHCSLIYLVHWRMDPICHQSFSHHHWTMKPILTIEHPRKMIPKRMCFVGNFHIDWGSFWKYFWIPTP